MRVLVVDDDLSLLDLLSENLSEWGHSVIACPDGEDAWEKIRSGAQPNVAILDWMLPGVDGLELCQRIRQQVHGPYVYLVMLTARVSDQDLLDGFEAGADDYLRKPFQMSELEARLRAGERIVELQRELIEAREAIRRQAMQDPLTNILNHGAIVDGLSKEIQRAYRERRPVSLIMADLDEFKTINDSFGHLVGDQVLIDVSRRMRRSLRTYDLIGRYGGEEFMIVLPGSQPEAARQLAERIRSVVSGEPFRFGRTERTVTISQGVATWSGPSPVTGERLIHAADTALYRVKKGGRNGVEHVTLDGAEQASIETPG